MALITVFGGSGGIGRQIVKLLAKKGHQVRVAVRDPHAALFLKPMGDVGQVTPVQANIRNEASVRSAVEGADAVINLVGILYETAAQTFDAVQAQGADLVARAAADAGARSLVHLSAMVRQRPRHPPMRAARPPGSRRPQSFPRSNDPAAKRSLRTT